MSQFSREELEEVIKRYDTKIKEFKATAQEEKKKNKLLKEQLERVTSDF